MSLISCLIRLASQVSLLRESSHTMVLYARGSCTAGNRPPVLTVWLFYVFAMSYDLLTLGISTYFLLSFGSNAGK